MKKLYRNTSPIWAQALVIATSLLLLLSSMPIGTVLADEPLGEPYESAVQKWADEFEPSVLSREELIK